MYVYIYIYIYIRYVMGKCPWCAKSMEKLAQNITCDFQCTRSDEVLTLLALLVQKQKY